MKRNLALSLMFLVVVMLAAGKNGVRAQERHTAKTIFANNRSAIVKVQVIRLQSDGKTVPITLGTGFIVSNNCIITANHVVNPPSLQGYLPGIQIQLSDGKVVKVTPILSAPSTDAKLYDYAVLRADETLKIPPLKLGTWKEVSEGDQLTTIGYALSLAEPLLLSVSASACFRLEGTDVVIFQGPNNRGLSGGPLISNQTGNVVGIVTSRLVGITQQLSEIRRGAARASGSARVSGVDPNAAIVELINVLDAYLMSGMGAAIAIDYAVASFPPTKLR